MLPPPLRTLTHLLARLPGVGEKTAQRFAMCFVGEGAELAKALGTALLELDQHIGACATCGNLAARDVKGPPRCSICEDPHRDLSLLCVVTKVQDLLALERSGAMKGRYFILGRLLSPLDGVGPESLPLTTLRERILADSVKEVILATPPSVDGEATALLLAQELEPLGVGLSRIASGLPHGGELEFADQITLGRAIVGRRGL